ncbi:hypothetical protein GX48_07838 [Paracoccidioides brasiliensis]|nr:hypothetical protein GX48_07838 [Paracoccidioides brasiliensis]
MINYRGAGPEVIVEEAQIIDLENAAYLPKGRCIKGMLAGNDSWRSPEGRFKGELNKPSDIFSFAACIYDMLKQVIFGADEDLHRHESQGAYPHVIRLLMIHVGEFKDLIGRMENLDPQKRATVAEALEHPWSAGYEIVAV